MSQFDSVKLEIVRPGPANNQLLSPLTQYMALCGESAPTTFTINLEHHEWLNKLFRLRYYDDPDNLVPGSIRESTVTELGKDVAGVLGHLKPLLVEQWRALGAMQVRAEQVSDQEKSAKMYVHVRLVASGSELSILPFELANAPEASPGEGGNWLLDSRLPVVLTREVRRSVSADVSWKLNTKPKVLVIIAEPGGSDVPKREHVSAITRALSPWIYWPKVEVGKSAEEVNKDRLPNFKKSIHILSQASIKEIQEHCSQHEYTHVHILAHGGSYRYSSDTRYGVQLCNHDDRSKPEIVSGKRLAMALTSQSTGGQQKSMPKFVCLATCDSANSGSVYTPGGSIAHDIHLAGVPWVIASQFPLTKSGSVRMTKLLFEGLFRGDDPRSVLHELRRDLYINAANNHDWASIVAYASFNESFDSEVHGTFQYQSRGQLDTSFDRIDNLEANPDAVAKNPINAESIKDKALTDAENVLADWNTRLPLAIDQRMESRTRRCEYHGMRGSKCKREALMLLSQSKLLLEWGHPAEEIEKLNEQASSLLDRALAHYRDGIYEQAYDGSKFHWVATQALSLQAILKSGADPLLFQMTSLHAEHQIQTASGTEKAWAHGTLAELELVRSYHQSAGRKNRKVDAKKSSEHCREIVAICTIDKFPIESTLRQFKRYDQYDLWKSEVWGDAVQGAIDELQKA